MQTWIFIEACDIYICEIYEIYGFVYAKNLFSTQMDKNAVAALFPFVI